VDRSYLAYKRAVLDSRKIPPTEVGGSFIPGLQKSGFRFRKYHQRKLVDRSYLAYKRAGLDSENTTNEVGGSFIPGLQKSGFRFRKIPPTKLVDCSYLAYKERVWIRKIPPTKLLDRSYLVYKRAGLDSENPTNCVGGIRAVRQLLCRQSMNNPPTALVVFARSGSCFVGTV
jgi:hypothetical protein